MSPTRLCVGDVTVDYTVIGPSDGSGEHVVFLHASAFQGWYGPLLERLDDVTSLRYQRTIAPGAPFDVEDDADAVLAVLAHAGFQRTHLVGHSYGGLVALELARRGPAAVRSLALLEPASSGFADEELAMAGLAPLFDVARTTGPAEAMERFLPMVLGEGSGELLHMHLPGAWDDAAAHAEQFFRTELPAIARWSFGAADAAAIDLPVLNVVGESSVPRFVATAQLLQGWFPHAERYELAGAGHLLMAQQPDAMAERLREFWSAA